MAVEATLNTDPAESANAIAPVGPDSVQAHPPERTDGGMEAIEQPGTEAQSSGGGTESASSPVSWLDDSKKALGKSYGFSDDELSEFKDEADFNRAARILDRQFAAFGQATRQPQQVQQPAVEPPKPVEQKPAAQATLPRVDIEKLKKAGWDEDTIAELAKSNQIAEYAEAQRTEFEKKLAQTEQIAAQFNAWQQYVQEMRQQEESYNFHSAVDSLGDARFGKAFDANGQPQQLTAQQHEQRRKLYEARLDIENGHMARGAQPPPMQIAVQRARNYAFADEIRAEERARVAKEIADQSARRRPVAQQPRTPTGQYTTTDKIDPFNLNQTVAAVANDPRLVAKWNQYQQDNGAVV